MDTPTTLDAAIREARIWHLIAQRALGETDEQLQARHDAILTDEPEAIND